MFSALPKRIVILLTLSSLCLFIGCTKKTSAPLDSSSLVKTIPHNSVGLIQWTTTSDGFKRFKNSTWVSKSNSFDAIQQPELKKILSVLEQLGLFHTSSEHIDKIKEGVGFLTVSSDTANPAIDFGFYVLGNEGEDLTAIVKNLQKELTSEGIAVKDISANGRSALLINVTHPIPFYPSHITVAAIKNKLSVASSATHLENGLLDNPTVTPNPLLESGAYKTLANEAQERSSFVIALLDLAKVAPAIKEAVNKVDPSVDISNLPLTFLTYEHGFVSGPSDTISVSFDPKTDDQKNSLKLLNNSSNDQLNKLIPGDALAAIQLDGASLERLGTLMSQDVSSVLLKKVARLSAVVRNASIGSLFPEVSVFFQSSDSAGLKKSVLENIKSLASESGLPSSAWKSTDISGIQIDYSLTPLGLGIYVGQVKDVLVVSSSEDIFRQLSGPNDITLAKLVKDNKLFSVPTISNGYFDFVKIASVLKDLQGTMALFTGGANQTDTDAALENLKNMGKFTFGLHYDTLKLTFESLYISN